MDYIHEQLKERKQNKLGNLHDETERIVEKRDDIDF